VVVLIGNESPSERGGEGANAFREEKKRMANLGGRVAQAFGGNVAFKKTGKPGLLTEEFTTCSKKRATRLRKGTRSSHQNPPQNRPNQLNDSNFDSGRDFEREGSKEETNKIF